MSSSASSSAVEMPAIGIPYIAITYITAILGIALNAIEINLIRKSWQKVTHFEIILLNLAVADTITGLGLLATASLCIPYLMKKINNDALRVCFYILIFAMCSSCCFVIMIAVERLKAIRKPFEQRARSWGKQGMFKCLTKLWILLLVCTIATSLTDWFVYRVPGSTKIGSKTQVYIVGSFLIFVSLIACALYAWIGILMRKQRRKLGDIYDKESNRRKFQEAKRQEVMIISVCSLIVSVFLICNIPFAINLYYLQPNITECILLQIACVFDPLVYFFKGYMERRQTKGSLKQFQGVEHVAAKRPEQYASSNNSGPAI